MKLNSKKVRVPKSAAELCAYLSDVKNFEKLMPETISKFEMINDKAFIFALKGMPEIALELKEVDPPNTIILGAMSDKLPFTLTGNIETIDATTSEIELEFQGEFSGMMGMMIKKPISKFIETLVTNLSGI